MRGPSAEATEVRFVTRPASQAEATGMLKTPTEPTQGAIQDRANGNPALTGRCAPLSGTRSWLVGLYVRKPLATSS